MPQRDPQQAWQRASTIGNDQWHSDLAEMDRTRKDAAVPERDASAKSLIDVLGDVLVPSKGSGLPRRLRLTSYSPDADRVMLHGVDKGQPVESTIGEFQRLHQGGALQREGPSTEGLSVPVLIKRLLAVIGE